MSVDGVKGLFVLCRNDFGNSWADRVKGVRQAFLSASDSVPVEAVISNNGVQSIEPILSVDVSNSSAEGNN